MPNLNVRMSPELHKHFLEQCEKRDVVASELIRDMIQRWSDMAEEIPRASLTPLPSKPIRRLATSGVVGFHPISGEPLGERPAYGSRLKQPKKAKE